MALFCLQFKGNYSQYSILSGQFFSFSILNFSFHWLLVSIVSLMLTYMWAFTFLLLPLRFSVCFCPSMVWLCLNIHLFTFVLHGIYWAFDEYMNFFCRFGIFFILYFFIYIFSIPFSVSIVFWATRYMLFDTGMIIQNVWVFARSLRTIFFLFVLQIILFICIYFKFILECEVKSALGSITMNKVSESDGVLTELVQLLNDDAVKVLHSICQQIWNTHPWLLDWKRSVFTPFSKKGNAKECSNYCTIALISHTSKVMLKILQAKLQQYVNCELPDVQVGFRKGRGTRDQTANVLWIMEKAREFQKNMYFCFIDYTKAFDCVDHHKLWKILKEVGIPDHLTCFLRNLYAGQEATVRTGHGTTDWFQIRKGVC